MNCWPLPPWRPHELKIAFFGSSLVSAYWNGAATYYRGILGALAARGHQITFYEPDAYGRQQHRDIEDPQWAQVVVYSSHDDTGVHQALDHARHADLIVKASGVGVFDELLDKAVLDIRRPGALTAFWDVDAPATLDRVQSNPADPFHALIPRYDWIFTYGGGDPVVNAYEALGAKECVPVYNALDPSTHFRVAPDTRFQADLAFLGNRLPDRESRVDEFFLNAGTLAPEQHFLLAGSGWHDKRVPTNVRNIGHLYTAEHNAFNSTPTAVLNISRESMARYGFSPATRVFEAAGAGACIITDYWEGIELFLEPGKEILVARDGDEVADHLRSLTPERARVHRPRRAAPRAGGTHLSPPRASSRCYSLTGLVMEMVVVKFVICGLSITSSWGNGHATTYRGLVRELAARGHEILFLERDTPWYAENRDLADPPYCRVQLYKSIEELKDRFSREVRQADVAIVGSYVPEGVAVAEWTTSIARGITAFYDIDTPVTLAKLKRGDEEYLSAPLIPCFDLYLSFTGGPTLRHIEKHYGAPSARVLYCSVDPAVYFPEHAPKTLGNGLPRDLRPGSPTGLGAPVTRTRPPHDRCAFPRGRSAVSVRHRVALECRARRSPSALGASQFLQLSTLHVERHARRYGAGRLLAQCPPV